MKVVKSTKKPVDNFLLVSNKILKDERVTAAARGVFLTVMSLPPDWDYSIAGLCSIFPAGRGKSKKAGRDNIYNRLNELIETGYVAKETRRGKQGTIEDWVYVFDPDGNANTLLTPKPEVAKPEVALAITSSNDTIKNSERLRIQNQLKIKDGETPIAAAADLRKDHPAIKGIQEVSKRYPPKDLWDVIIEKLGSDVDGDHLKQCWTEWLLRGYKPTNLAWALEWYRDGIPGKPNGHNGGQVGRSTVGRQKAVRCDACNNTGWGEPSPEAIAAGFPAIGCPVCRSEDHEFVMRKVRNRPKCTISGEL